MTTAERAAVRAEMARELLEISDDATGCSFFACPGPDAEPIDMATCKHCWMVHDLKAEVGALEGQR